MKITEFIKQRKTMFIEGVFFILVAVAIGLFLFYTSGCGPMLEVADTVQQKALEGQGCKPEATKCEGQSLQICQADHTWTQNVACGEYLPARACCNGPKGPGCYRPEDCEEEKTDGID